MTIYAVGKFNNIYDGYDLLSETIDRIKASMEQDIISDNSHDPKLVVTIEQANQPSIYGMNGMGIVGFKITVLTCLSRVKVRDYDYPWDTIVLADYQTYNDYTYDGEFFHVARDDSKRSS